MISVRLSLEPICSSHLPTYRLPGRKLCDFAAEQSRAQLMEKTRKEPVYGLMECVSGRTSRHPIPRIVKLRVRVGKMGGRITDLKREVSDLSLTYTKPPLRFRQLKVWRYYTALSNQRKRKTDLHARSNNEATNIDESCDSHLT